tara:strand:- start:47 stop:247 length:201 start_codon:yes stop_codon:yes gene_type:complete
LNAVAEDTKICCKVRKYAGAMEVSCPLKNAVIAHHAAQVQPAPWVLKVSGSSQSGIDAGFGSICII